MSKVKFIALTMAILMLLMGAVALALPATVWVNVTWTGTPLYTPIGGHTFGVDAFATIADGVNGVAAGGTVNVAVGTYALASTVNLNKVGLLVKGAGPTTIVTAGNAVGYAFDISASGVTLRDIWLKKTDLLGEQNLIRISASNVSILNNKITGLPTVVPGTWPAVSRAILVQAGSITGLLIDGNTIYSLRHPGYFSGTTVGTISNNAVSDTRGWINEGAQLTFTNNTWPLLPYPNGGRDISLDISVNPAWYPDLLALSNANNDCYITVEAGLMGAAREGRATSWVDAAAAVGGLGRADLKYKTVAAGVVGTLPGGTCRVTPGTYNEGPQVVIAKNLSIVPDVAGIVTIKPTANTSNAGDTKGWFLVNAGVVFNLTGVTLDGSGFKIFQGIRSYGSGTINGNNIKNIGYNPSTDYAGTGIVAFGDNGTVISNNTFSNIGRVGVLIYGVTATFTGNNYTGKGTGDFLDYGVELGAGAVADVIGNTFTACRGVASVDGSTSAGAIATTYYAAGTTGHFKGNTFTNSTAGLGIGGDALDASIVTVTDGNMFDGNDYGIQTSAAALISLTVLGNTFQNNSIIGLDVHSALANVQSNIFCCGNTLNASDDVPYGTNTYDMNYWNDWSGVGAYYGIFPGPLPGANVDWNPSVAYGLNMTPDVVAYNAPGNFWLTVNIEECVKGLNAAEIWLEYPSSLTVAPADVVALDNNFTIYSTQATVGTLTTLKVYLGVLAGVVPTGPKDLFKIKLVGSTSCVVLGSEIKMVYRDLRNNSAIANSIPAPLASPTTFTSNAPTIVVLSPAGLLPTGGYYRLPPVLNLKAEYGCDLSLVQTDIEGWNTWPTIASGLTGTTWTAPWSIDLSFWNSLVPGYPMPDGLWYIRFAVQADDGRWNDNWPTYKWYFTKDTQAPPKPATLTAKPGNNKVHLTWTHLTGDLDYDHTVVMRKAWFNLVHGYPLYATGAVPEGGYPLDTLDGTKVFSGAATSYIDVTGLTNSTRDIYHYVVFNVDKAGNVSPASDGAKSTSYWLGDINLAGAYDGVVHGLGDLTPFGNSYFKSTGDPLFNPEADFAPTFGGAQGIPLPNGVVDFEELNIFAINYDSVSATLKTRPTLPGIPIQRETALRVAQRMTTTTFDVDLYLDNRDDLAKALIGEVTYDPTMLEYVSTVEGKDLAASQLPVFFKALTSPKQISVSAAVLGNGSTIDGSGLIATISFRVLGTGKTTVQLTKAVVRDKDNNNLVGENIQLPGTEAVVDVPATYEIAQNQPNPFNPETVIKYALPNATQVSIRIYNIVGQLVKTLVDDYQPAGQHQVVWNGTSENGERVASGIYLYRFVTPDHQQTLKMTLLK